MASRDAALSAERAVQRPVASAAVSGAKTPAFRIVSFGFGEHSCECGGTHVCAVTGHRIVACVCTRHPRAHSHDPRRTTRVGQDRRPSAVWLWLGLLEV